MTRNTNRHSDDIDYVDGLEFTNELDSYTEHFEATDGEWSAAPMRKRDAWRSVERRADAEWLRRELSDWDEYLDIH